MRNSDFTEGEIFARFADIMMKDNRLEKKAEFLYADFDTSVKPELDLGWGVFAGARDSLYGVTKETGEQLVGDAHPGGGLSTQLDHKPEKDLGKVETIVERQKTMKEVAKKTPTPWTPKVSRLVEKLVALADKLDRDGFTVLAQELDTQMQKFAEAPASMPAGALDTAPGAHLPPNGPQEESEQPEQHS